MSEENLPNDDELNNNPEDQNEDTMGDHINVKPLSGLYEDWFLDYASYVILERAVPALEDGLKPVQRRILHSMKEMDDGRYNKVANIIGNTMKYHPHGDASIGDALVQLGQKDLLIDTQGNWGNTLTGDSAAAPRYIEARLSKFASAVVFNPKTTAWAPSYDGRNKEPIKLPIKFPILLAQGAEGIAVGMACKLLPHNFNELIDASIDILRGKKVAIYPDFPNGGMADFSNYNDGLRGGKVRIRAKIKKEDAKTLVISDIPYGTTTSSLIDSIIKANDKGKIKVKKIEDNTAKVAEIIVHLAPGVSPDKTIDALYAFSDCEVSISPNASIIYNDKPRFLGVSEMLTISTDQTVDLLHQELKIRLGELQEKWHISSLEKIFIENRIYRDFEDKTYDEAIVITHEKLKPHIKHLIREVTDEDVKRLLEIRMRRITKHDAEKADELLISLEAEIKEVNEYLDNLIEYAINYFKDLKKRFGDGKERKTEIRSFENIQATRVIISNKKLYVNREDGFIGWNLKKDEYISDCSEIDDVILFYDSGKVVVTKVAEKKFVGKGLLHIAVWKKGDKRTIYHMIYRDGPKGAYRIKRFYVNAVTRDKEYELTKGTKGSKIVYFSVNPNGQREIIGIQLKPRPHLKRLKFDIDFGEVLVKGRASQGNVLTKEIIAKITQKEIGGSTLSARKIWYDPAVRRLNDDGRGVLLGQFKGNDKILTIYKSGYAKLINFDLSQHFEDDLEIIEKWYPERSIAAVYWSESRELYYVKRFLLDESSKKQSFIPEEDGNQLVVVSTLMRPRISISFNKRLKETKNLADKEVNVNEFIDVKGIDALGNQLTKLKVKDVTLLTPVEEDQWPKEEKINTPNENSDDEEVMEEKPSGNPIVEEPKGPTLFD